MFSLSAASPCEVTVPSVGFALGGDPDIAWVQQADRVQQCMSAWHPGSPAQLQSETPLAESLLESAVCISRLVTVSNRWGTMMLVYQADDVLRADVGRMLATEALECNLVVLRAAHLRVGGAAEAWATELDKDCFSPEIEVVPGASAAHNAGGKNLVFLTSDFQGNGDVNWTRLMPWLARQLAAASRQQSKPTFVACTCRDLCGLLDRAFKPGTEPKGTVTGLDAVLLGAALRKETPLPSAKARKTEVSVGAAIDKLRARCHIVFGAVPHLGAQKRKCTPTEEELLDRRRERERGNAERKRALAADALCIDAGFAASRLLDERAERSVLVQLDEHFDEWRRGHANGSVDEWWQDPEGLPSAASPLQSLNALLIGKERQLLKRDWWRHLYRCAVADQADGGGGTVDHDAAVRGVTTKWARAVRRSDVLRALYTEDELEEQDGCTLRGTPLFFPVNFVDYSAK